MTLSPWLPILGFLRNLVGDVVVMMDVQFLRNPRRRRRFETEGILKLGLKIEGVLERFDRLVVD
jgi:hypothetical protein